MKWLKLTCVVVLLCITVPSYRNHFFFLNFVDEDDNIVIGNYAGEGKKLYSDVFTQHQPITYIMSAAWQKITQPPNLLMVIKRHHEFVIFWSTFWILVLTLRFGWPIFLTVTTIELTKIVLLGNLFLAESLVVYPLLYVVAYLLSSKEQTKVNLEILFLIVLIWFIWFSLAPLWPILTLLLLWLWHESLEKRKLIGAIGIIGLSYLCIILPYSNIAAYWIDAIQINYQYYIPLTTELGLASSLIKALAAPLFALLHGGSGTLLFCIKTLSLGFVMSLYFLIRDHQYKRVGLLIGVLGLTSLRYISPANTLYGAFHMLPWLTVLTGIGMYEMDRVWLTPSRRILVVGVLIIIGISSCMVAKESLWNKEDMGRDYYIHYSPSEDIQKAVAILSQDTAQTIWVEPVLYWPYWHTGAHAYSSMINYYGWMDKTPPLAQALQAQLKQELPTIVWITDQSLGIHEYLSEYRQFKRDGKFINLYLRKDKVGEITPSQQSDLAYYRFVLD